MFSPLLPVVTKDGVYVLDMAAKIDATADYICKAQWGDVEFPPPFGREAYPEVREHLGAAAAAACSLSWGRPVLQEFVSDRLSVPSRL